MPLNLPPDIAVNKKNILEHLAREIISGKLKHNDIIPNEIDFAASFGVSRTMIRDVLKILELKGLIERRTNVGTRIRSINSWNLLDQDVLAWSSTILTGKRFLLSLMEMRMIIEPQAAALAALRADDDDLVHIRGDYHRMLETDAQTGQPVLNTDMDIEFHKSILKACGNLFLSQFGGAIRGALYHTIYLSNKLHIDHQASHDCHRMVLTAIEDRDPTAAYSAMCRVLNNAICDLELKVNGVILADFDTMKEAQSGKPKNAPSMGQQLKTEEL